MGIYAYLAIGREHRRLESGWTYEPPTFHERNLKALALEKRAAERERPLPAGRRAFAPDAAPGRAL
jgi:hypothetical protein